MIKNHKNKQNINSEVNENVNAAQTKGVLSSEGQLLTNLSATVDLRKNEVLEDNSFIFKVRELERAVRKMAELELELKNAGYDIIDETKNVTAKPQKPKPRRQIVSTKAKASESLRLKLKAKKAKASESLRLKLKAKKQKNWQKWCALSVEERQEIMSAKWESLPSEPWFRSLVHVLPYLLFLRDHKDYTKRKDEVAGLLGFLALRHNEKRGRVANKIWHQDYSNYCNVAYEASEHVAGDFDSSHAYTSWGHCGVL